ncbi:MAG: tetratricopeptide (TPR) repeat protein [Candidatus Latescibacterota bacterium]|jgi:tetratricopeptide (TPR) repeat protein
MMQSKWFYPVLIVLAGAVVYANSLQNGFTFDDWPLVAQNPLVMQPHIGAIFSSAYWPDRPELGLYRPLTTLSYAINRLVLGEGPWGFHLVNVALHIVNALLVFVGMRKILERPFAGLCALIFLLHPVQTEAVNSIVGRAELLAAFWMLMAWIAFAYGVGRWRWILAALAIFLGCLCKEHTAMMVGVLAVVAFSGLFYTHRDMGESKSGFMAQCSRFFKESLSGIVLCIGVVGLFLWMRYAVIGAVLLPSKPTFIDNPLAHVDHWQRWFNALSVIWRYTVLMFWPSGFSADYSFQAIPLVASLWHGSVLAGLIVVLGLLGFIVFSVRRPGFESWVVAALWIALPALPVSNLLFLIGTVMAERFMYAPMVGYGVLCGLYFSSIGARRPGLAFAIALVLLAGLAKNTTQRNPDWQNDYTLFGSAVKVVPESAKAHFNFGNAIRDRGNLTAALPHYRKALWIYPDYAEVHYNVGVIQQGIGRVEDALTAYENTLTANPTHVNAWTNVGILLAQKGVYDKACEAFEKALQLEPKRVEIKFNYALALQRLNRLDEARKLYLEILDDAPDHEDAAINLAESHIQRDEKEQAIAVLDDIVYGHGRAYQAALNLATILEKEERYEDALRAFLKGAEGPGERSVLALFGVARLYGRLGKLDEARGALNLFVERWTGDAVFKVRAQKMLKQLNMDG